MFTGVAVSNRVCKTGGLGICLSENRGADSASREYAVSRLHLPAAVKAGVKLEDGFHSLRHTLASFLLSKKKTDDKTVQCSLRHAKSSTTIDHHAQTHMFCVS